MPENFDSARCTPEDQEPWRKLFAEQLTKVETQYQPCYVTDIDDLADMLSACVEGGIILSRVLKNPLSVSKQILHYRDYLRLLYDGISGEQAG